MMRSLLPVLILTASPAFAESMVATRTIRAQSVITAEDITMVAAEIPGALATMEGAVGLETRVTLYAGRPVRAGDLASPALVQRNQIVSLVFQAGGLTILTDGRALERGAAGEMIQVMNLSSHLKVQGLVGPDGSVRVGPNKG